MQKKKNIIRTFHFVILLILGTSLAQSQVTSSEVDGQKVSIEMHEASLGDVFFELMTRYGIPIGFEESILDRSHNDFDFAINLSSSRVITMGGNSQTAQINTKQTFAAQTHKFDLKFIDQPLSAVFDSIVKQMDNNYEWKVDGGVVNFFPRNGRDVKYVSLLNLKIAKFHLDGNKPRQRVRGLVLKLPELSDFLLSNGLCVDSLRGGYDAFSMNQKVGIDLDFSNITLKELLNGIIAKKSGGWILKKHDMSSIKGCYVIDILI